MNPEHREYFFFLFILLQMEVCKQTVTMCHVVFKIKAVFELQTHLTYHILHDHSQTTLTDYN